MKALSVASSLRGVIDRRHRGSVALLVLVGTVAGLCEGIGVSLFLPLLRSLDPGGFDVPIGGALGRWFSALFDSVPPTNRLRVVLASMFGLLIVKALLASANGLLFARLDARLVHDLRLRVAQRILGSRLGAIETRPTGDLLALLQSQTWEASGAVATLVGIVIRLVTVLAFGCALLLISWRLTLVVAAALLAISWAVHRLSRKVDRLSEEGVGRWNRLVQRCVELLRGLRTTHAFSREQHELERFERTSSEASGTFFRLERVRALVEPLSELMVAALLAVVLLLALDDPAQLPAVLTFLFILFRLQPQVQRLDSARVRLASAAAPVRAVTAFLDTAVAANAVAQGKQPYEGLVESITFDAVTFRYDGQADDGAALHSAHATIPARRTTAIVGPSGAGKSTLAYLLLRFADPTSGVIRVDGVPLTELDLADWRAGIALVSQDTHVFHESVADNIRYGRPDATDAEVRDAARRAHAHEFITNLPQGYDTLLGEDGVQLSGGQRQRIALARALIRRAGILILDEATNALDSIAENVIQDALAELAGSHTMLVIAHRLATIEEADHVLVLDHGSVTEQGTRSALLAEDGLFAKLHALQFGRTP